MKNKRVPFSKQFVQCTKEGLTKIGPLISYKEYPELLPLNPRLAKKMMNDSTGIRLIECERFGGRCSSQHIKCKKMRNAQF